MSTPLPTSEAPVLRAVAVRSGGGFDVAAASDVITLDHHSRRRRRCLLVTDGGRELLLDLAHVARIVDGDALELADGGGHVTVRAAPEDLLEIRAADKSRLIRIAWHLGNRHTPAEITSEAIYIAADHVLEEMLVGLGAQVRRVSRPFEPEGGAYAGHTHSHSHER